MLTDVKGHPWLIAAAADDRARISRNPFRARGRRRKEKGFRAAGCGTAPGSALSVPRAPRRRSPHSRLLRYWRSARLGAEGLPNAILEYLAAGLPTVATRVGGNAEILQDAKTGLLVPPEDSAALAEAILHLLRDPEFAASLGKNGREYVARNSVFSSMIETLTSFTPNYCARGVRNEFRPGGLEAGLPARAGHGPRGNCRPPSPAGHRPPRPGCATRQASTSRRKCSDCFEARSRDFSSLQSGSGVVRKTSPAFSRTSRIRSSSVLSESASIASTCWVTTRWTTGLEIDWHCDRVHGKRAPRKPWFRMKYLDFAEVGDSKVTWELNRHQHLVTLAKAYRLTGDQKFCCGVVSPVGALACGESVSHGHQLGEQPGSCFSQPFVALGLFSNGGFARHAGRVSICMASRLGSCWTAH